jgi:hypothetical protein
MKVHLIDKYNEHFFFNADDVKCIIETGRVDMDICTIHLTGVQFDVCMKAEEVIRIVTEALENEV